MAKIVTLSPWSKAQPIRIVAKLVWSASFKIITTETFEFDEYPSEKHLWNTISKSSWFKKEMKKPGRDYETVKLITIART